MIVRLDDGVVSLLHANLKGERKMKKRIFSLLLVIAMLVTVLPVNAFAADDDCDHSNNRGWSQSGINQHYTYCYDCGQTVYGNCDQNGFAPDTLGTGHYQACSVCGRKASYTLLPHTCDNWSVSNYRHTGTCEDCGASISGGCSYSGQPYITEDGQHWQECSVCGTAGKKTPCAPSPFSTATPNTDGVSHSVTCATCGETSSAACTFGNYISSGNQGHYKKCSVCGNKTALSAHANKTYSPAYGDEHTIKCADCGYSLGYGDCQYGDYTRTATQHSRTCALCGDTVTNNHYFKNGVCECGAEKHDHKWEVSASGNTITVKCTGATGTCEYDKDGGKLTVSASNAVYDGKAKAATITNTIKTGSYNDGSYSVTYYEKQANGNYSSIYSAPSNVGEYKVEVYSYLDSNKKASATFAITAKPVTVSATGYTGTYDGNAHGITVNGLEGTGLSVQYATSQNGYYSSSAPTYTDAGEYTVYYKVTGSNIDNYEITGQTGSAVVKINPVQVSVTATGYTGAYDGKAHGITVEVPEGLTVTYSEKENGYYNYYSSPKYTDAGTYTVYYKVTGDKNHTVTNGTGSATVTINKADLKTAVKAMDYDGVYDGKAHGITVEAPDNVTISYSKDGEDWYGSNYANSYTDVGEYTVYYKVAISEYLKKNFTNSEVTGSAKVKITTANLADLLTETAEDTEFTFNRSEWTDGEPHSIKLDVKESYVPGTSDYVTVEYSTDGGATWSTTNPRFRDAGTYTVNYRIYVKGGYPDYGMSANYIPIEGSKTVTIKKADLPITELVGYHGPYDGSTHYGFGYKYTTSYGDYFTLYWYNYLHKELDYDFSWTDEKGVARTLTVKAGEEPKLTDFPGFTKQNVKEVDYDDDTGDGVHQVTVTIGSDNYNEKTFNYYVQIGPGGAYAKDTTYVYDGDEHYIANYIAGQWYYGYGEVYNFGSIKIEYREAGSDTWLPYHQEPGQTDVGSKDVEWRVTMDSDQNGVFGEERNSFGSSEVFIGKNTVTVTAAPLTVTANDNTITYGDEPAHSGAQITGYVNGENADALDGELTFTYDYAQYDDVGEYKITPTGLTAKNYEITYVDGKLTVEQKELSIVWGETVLPYTGEAQAPTATASGTVNGDEIALTVHGAQTDVGRYMATVTGITGEKAGNYKLPANCDVDYEIVKAVAEAPAVTAKDETIKGKKDGGIVGLTTEMEYSADGGETWTKVTDPAVELAPGTYLVRYTETTTSDASAATEVTINPGKYLTVTLPEGEGYTTSTEEKADEQTYNDTFTFEVEIKDGYSKGENFKVTANGQELTPNEDGSYTITGIVEDVEVKVEGVVDNTAPTGTITVATNQWKEFVNNITFGIFFKNTQTVTITAEDTGSGIKSIEYIACEAVLTEEYVKAIVASEWKSYTAPFEIDPDAKVIVYAKITDKAGNVKFISSDGMVFDGTAPVFNGVQDGGEYNEETKFTVTDDNLDKVTVDGVEVKPDENGNYTLPMDNKEHVIVATDKSGNKTEITVTLRDIYNVTLPKGDGYETKGEPTVKDGDDYTFEVEIKDGYAKGDDFKVTVNGQEIKPNADGKYVVENVTSDLEIVVSGVEKVKAPAPTTETPKTGDEGLFLPLMLFMLSGIACVSLIAFKKKFRF